MKKFRKKIRFELILLILLFFIIFLILNYPKNYNYSNESLTDEIKIAENTSEYIEENFQRNIKNSTTLHFYDKKTGCNLNGAIYINDFLIGNTSDGYFNLTNYSIDFDIKNISLKGITDNCIDKKYKFKFIRYWGLTKEEILDYYQLNFVAEISPRQPLYCEERGSFINPEQAKIYLEKINKLYQFENESLRDLEKIYTYHYKGFNYQLDEHLYGQKEYWAMPEEILGIKQGDCEDWTTSFLSLIKAYNNSLKCYAVSLPTHLATYCYLGEGRFAFYDQKGVYLMKKIKPEDSLLLKKADIRGLRNDYFEVYGIKPQENKIEYVFDETDCIYFLSNENFVEWSLSLI